MSAAYLHVKNASHISGCVSRSIATQVKGVITPSTRHFVRLHLKYCDQLWTPQIKKDTTIVEQGQQRATKTVRDWNTQHMRRKISQL